MVRETAPAGEADGRQQASGAQVRAGERRRRFESLEAVGGCALVSKAEWDAVIEALREARVFARSFVTGAPLTSSAAWVQGRELADKIARVLEAVGE